MEEIRKIIFSIVIDTLVHTFILIHSHTLPIKDNKTYSSLKT